MTIKRVSQKLSIIKTRNSSNMKFAVVILCSFLVCLAFCQVDEATAFVDPAEKCIDLNKQREDLQACCEYPHIPFFKIFAHHCVNECVGTKDICCAMVCVWRNTQVTFSEEGAVNLAGLKKSLLQSVHFKDEWHSLIHKAVDQCDSEVKQDFIDKTCKLPANLPGLINCATKSLFLMCPSMHNSTKCETTRKYVEQCL